MRPRFSVALLVVVVLLSAAYVAVALGRNDSDPNAPGTKQVPAELDIWNADSRLAQKITYSVRRKTVSAILADLQARTGVPLNAGATSGDWQVRDRKMVIFARDLPLSDLMQSISRVMKFRWSRSGDNGKWSYRLYVDTRMANDLEAEKQRDEQFIRDREIRKRQAMRAKLTELAQMTPAEIAKLKQNSPYFYFLGKSGLAAGFNGLFSQPALADAFDNRKTLDVSKPDPSAGYLRAMVNAGRIDKSLGGRQLPRLDVNAIKIQSVSVNGGVEEDSSFTGFGMFCLGFVTVNYSVAGSPGWDTLHIPLADPNSTLGKAYGSRLATAMDNPGAPLPPPKLEIKPDELLELFSAEPLPKDDDPALQRQIEFKPDPESSSKDASFISKSDGLLASLSEASGMSVVADALGESTHLMDFAPKPNERMKLIDALKGIALARSSNWWSNQVLEFRDLQWFAKRKHQIPEAYMEKWRQKLKATSTLELDDLAEVALRLQEPGSTVKYDFNTAGDEIFGHTNLRETSLDYVLQWYATLDASQRAAALTESGLGYSQLTPDQRNSASNHLGWLYGTEVPDEQKQTLWVVAERKSGQATVYKFLSPTRQVLASITAPRYVEPKAHTVPAAK